MSISSKDGINCNDPPPNGIVDRPDIFKNTAPRVKFDGIRDGEMRRTMIVHCSCCTGKCEESTDVITVGNTDTGEGESKYGHLHLPNS